MKRISKLIWTKISVYGLLVIKICVIQYTPIHYTKKTKNMNYFKELKVWQKSIDLVTDTYLLTRNFPKEELFGLVSQIRRCIVSVPSNIAEGCGRKSQKDFSNFLGISLGSSFEFETQLIISKNIGYLTDEQFNKLESEIQHIQNMIIKLQTSLENK